MDESRKRVLGIMAAILAARKLAQYDGPARVPATIYAIEDAIIRAEQIMREIDRKWLVTGCLLGVVRASPPAHRFTRQP